jgi:putative addiction module component (TIGR02574 family)
MVTPLDALLKLPKTARMEMAEKLWLSVATEKSLAVPAAHKRILDDRLERYRSGQSKPVPHGEMMSRLRRK